MSEVHYKKNSFWLYWTDKEIMLKTWETTMQETDVMIKSCAFSFKS